MSIINLVEKHHNDSAIRNNIQKLNLIKDHPKYKVGQFIEFNGGYNNDIRYLSEITGFDSDGQIYLLWDCYWFPIRDEASRNIKLVQS